MTIKHSEITSEMMWADRTLAGKMGGDNAPSDARVPRELELIPVSQFQESKQEVRGEPIVNNSQIAEFVWHVTKQNVRTHLLAVCFLRGSL